ncbi:hypothetical protein EON65_09540 [archaeon]|nr:MAG: hypothetical protein EON65_09540 [archaeon]
MVIFCFTREKAGGKMLAMTAAMTSSASNHGVIPGHANFGLEISLSRLSVYVFATLALTYLAFQKHLLPDPIAKVVSKMFFHPTFPITALLRLGNYWTKIDDTLLMGCAPFDMFDHPKALKNMGVDAVINMCYEYDGPIGAYEKLGIKQLRLPTVDHNEVPLFYIMEAMDFIQKCKEKGQKVLVHCKAGNGRAASIALCWMMRQNRDKSAKVSYFTHS